MNHLLDCPGDVSGKQHFAAPVSAALQLVQPRCSIPVNWGFLGVRGPGSYPLRVLDWSPVKLNSILSLPVLCMACRRQMRVVACSNVPCCVPLFCYDSDSDSRDPARGLGTGWNLDRIGQYGSRSTLRPRRYLCLCTRCGRVRSICSVYFFSTLTRV